LGESVPESIIFAIMDNILVVDDERNIRTLVSRVLAQDPIEVHGAGTGKDGLQMADEVDPDVVLLDLRLPDMDGMDVLRTLKSRYPHVAVIIITGYGQIQSAVEAIKSGAADYLEKPFEHLEKLKLAVTRALEEVRAKREVRRLHGLQEKQYRVDQLIGESESTRALRDLIGKLARSEAQTILVHGESGTGKELVACGLHYESARRDFPFMEVNCAAITETLFESELFGHEKGAFTDAKSAKKGLMELADRGTLLLDEVSEMSLNMQAKFLRCLQERVVRRVGGTRDIRVDVRIVAATNRPLETRVKDGHFREDLFYRLNVIPIYIPPLRERREDIMPLARHFLREVALRSHKSIQGFTPEAERMMLAYAWPGNVRELRNLIERLVILGTSEQIEPQHLPVQFSGHADVVPHRESPQEFRTLAEVERAYINQVMQRVEANKSKAAKILGISRQTLRKKLMEEG
jgi:DNA-binding NtrC family response regulator